ncbi:MAG: hypothetical protein M1829_001905 [Trizodia sp. TS-e1964]|nr:MAG: hypothetical protein M1829_001905 [Trizodia sp. TS-e1964]
MKPKQATLGKFFGAPSGRPAVKSSQSRLAFSSSGPKSRPAGPVGAQEPAQDVAMEDADGGADGGEEELPLDQAKGEHIEPEAVETKKKKKDRQRAKESKSAIGVETTAPSSSGSKILKVEPSATHPTKKRREEVWDKEESDDEPVTKRPRRVDRRTQEQLASSPPQLASSPLAKATTAVEKKENEASGDIRLSFFDKKTANKVAGEPTPKSISNQNKAGKSAPQKVKQEDEQSGDEPVPNPIRKKTDQREKPSLKKSRHDEDSDSKPVLKAASNKAKTIQESSAEEEKENEEDELDESEDDVKPEVAARAREKVQSSLQASSKDPYPDWKPGEPVPYAALCTTFSLVELTTKRLLTIAQCSLFLRQVLRLTPNDLLPTVQLMINKLAADYAGIELGIGESLIMKAIGETTGRSLQVIKADQKEIGDLGLVAAKSRGNQPTMFKPKPLTVRGVHQGLMAIATVQGNGAQDRKVAGIKKLLAAADAESAGKGKSIDITKDKGGASEAKFIIRFLEGKLRLGLADRTVLVSLAQAMVIHETESQGKKLSSTDQLAKGEEVLKTVYSELPSYEVIIPAMLEHGIFNLKDTCKLKPGVPLKPMLAKPTKAITEVLDRFENKSFTCEYKYDGERAQIHYVAHDSPEKYGSSNENGLSAIFSRNSEDLSKKYPDILVKLHTWVKPGTKSFVLDCESVAWDLEEKKVLPFQQLMTRKRKDVKVEDVKVKVCVFAFDILFLNGEAIVKKSLRERRELLMEAFEEVEGEFAFAKFMNTDQLEEVQTFLDESVKSSCEGLMVKMLDGEESGYEPSKRSRNWLKIKKDYLSGLGDSLDLVVLGAYFGRGKRTSVYGAFLLACYNSSNDTYETICNIGTGFSEAALEALHAELSTHLIDRPKPFYARATGPKDQPDVWFEPRCVWEVKAADLTLSPKYRAAAGLGLDAGARGVSLRFPRFVRVREDKTPDQATGSRQVAEMYRRQESVAKSRGPAVDDDFEY